MVKAIYNCFIALVKFINVILKITDKWSDCTCWVVAFVTSEIVGWGVLALFNYPFHMVLALIAGDWLIAYIYKLIAFIDNFIFWRSYFKALNSR